MNEYIMPGGVYWEGDDREGDRTDISLVECGTGEPGNPFTFQLNITTGNGSYGLCSILPEDMKRIGEFLKQVAESDRRSE